VVLVLGILMAIAIPTFLGARSRSQDTQPQASLRIELEAAKIAFTDNNSFGTPNTNACAAPVAPAVGANFSAIEPSITCQASTTAARNPILAGASAKVVSVYILANPNSTTVANVVAMAARSSSGQCFFIKSNETTGQVTYGKATANTTNCNGVQANASATAASW
jgi:type IV pilus assembly protein PilA